MIAALGPLNEMTVAFTQTLTTMGLEDLPTSFEAGPLKELESRLFDTTNTANISEWSKTSERLTTALTPLPPGEEWEIKA